MQDKIKALLILNEGLRDSDQRLIWSIWAKEISKIEIMKNECRCNHIECCLQADKKNKYYNIKNLPVTKALELWKEGILSDPSAIRRARRKVQEENPETRGELWEKRHKQQEQVQEDLGYNVHRV